MELQDIHIYGLLVKQTSSINNLNAGVYDYLITDANGCTIQDSITITQPDSALSAIQIQLSVLCNGGSDGSFSVNVLEVQRHIHIYGLMDQLIHFLI